MTQVEHAHAATRDLVLIGGPDAAPRRADCLARRALAVDELVIRQHEMRPVAHVEAPLDVDAIAHELIDLGEQRLGIEHDAVSDRAAHAGMQNAARNLMEDEGAIAELHGVAGIRTALVAHDPVSALGDHVHELSLPFVAPLRADDDESANRCAEHACSESVSGWRGRAGRRPREVTPKANEGWRLSHPRAWPQPPRPHCHSGARGRRRACGCGSRCASRPC